MTMKKLMAALCAGAFISSSAMAAVTQQQADRLSKDLTPMGAERGANADGSIPAWNPKGTPIPAGYVEGSANYINPYADEKPLYVVNNDNWKEYKEFLTEGSIAVFEKLGPEGFYMDIYPTKRDYVVPEWVYENTRKNAITSTLEADGQKVVGAVPGVPFPLPTTGQEVMWNHLNRHLTDMTFDYDVYYVNSAGKPVLSTTADASYVIPMYKKPDEPVANNAWVKLRINYTAPARRAGEILLVHEPGADFTDGKGRKAWQYLTGQRRVRLAPAVSFDTPNPAVAGTSTYDDSFIFNGSQERFDWKLIGKAEKFIPYSNYDFLFQEKVEDILKEKFLDPSKVRWEKHRVWIVEATLKEGKRHLYSKRRFYFDEDSWAALASDSYDGRGNLWRVQYAYGANLYDIKSNFHFAYGAYDLLQNIYNLNSKPIPGTFKNGVDKKDKYFTPKGMSRGGVR